MKKFDCVVERVDKYTVEMNEEVFNESWMADFRGFYYDFETLEEHAEHIAQFRARFGSRHIEGYGVPLENGKAPYWAKEDEINKDINIIITSEDGDIDTYVVT